MRTTNKRTEMMSENAVKRNNIWVMLKTINYSRICYQGSYDAYKRRSKIDM
jgi:hypothetical protein